MSYPKKISRETVLDAAMAFIDAHGLAELSMRTLAADLGVTPNALYRYFPAKAELEFAMADEAGRMLLQALVKAAAHKAMPLALQDAARAYIRFALKHPQWYAVKMRHCRHDGSEPDSHTEVWRLVMGLADKLHTPWNAKDLAMSWWAFLHGMVELAHAGQLDDQDPEAAIAVGLDVMLAGLAARAGPTA